MVHCPCVLPIWCGCACHQTRKRFHGLIICSMCLWITSRTCINVFHPPLSLSKVSHRSAAYCMEEENNLKIPLILLVLNLSGIKYLSHHQKVISDISINSVIFEIPMKPFPFTCYFYFLLEFTYFNYYFEKILSNVLVAKHKID